MITSSSGSPRVEIALSDNSFVFARDAQNQVLIKKLSTEIKNVFMSPEYAFSRDIGPCKQDSWNIGVYFYKLLSGKWPLYQTYEKEKTSKSEDTYYNYLKTKIVREEISNVIEPISGDVPPVNLRLPKAMIYTLMTIDVSFRPTPQEYISQYRSPEAILQ